MIPLTRPAFGPEEEAAVSEVLRSGWVAQGPTTAAFEREFAAAVGVPHAVAVSSCTTALHLAVVAAGVGPGDEVILPAFTFPATANAVLYAGGVPVLADIDPATLNLDPELARKAVTSRTKAIIGVHLFGAPCEIDALGRICRDHDLVLIEDAACAVGTKVGDRMAGSFGDIACFSLHARKVLTTGEGGMLTTSRSDLAEILQSLRTHGADRGAEAREGEGLAPPSPRYVRLGYNYRLSDVQSAIGRVQLRKLAGFVRERGELAQSYDEALADLPGLRRPPRAAGLVHSYQSYVTVLEPGAPLSARDVMNALAARGISTRPGTYAVHREPYYSELAPDAPPLPESEHAARASVALPLYNGMPPADVRIVAEALHDAWKDAASPAS